MFEFTVFFWFLDEYFTNTIVKSFSCNFEDFLFYCFLSEAEGVLLASCSAVGFDGCRHHFMCGRRDLLLFFLKWRFKIQNSLLICTLIRIRFHPSGSSSWRYLATSNDGKCLALNLSLANSIRAIYIDMRRLFLWAITECHIALNWSSGTLNVWD